MSSKRNSDQKRIAYQEFGIPDNPTVFDRAVKDLAPEKQDLRIQTTRAGRKGKTVTVITGLIGKPETLDQLLKNLKTQCGSGGTVKETTIELQGDHKQKVLETLTKLGYKAKISGG